MLLYRVFFYDPGAREGAVGHAKYLHKPQGKGRWDNPSLYDAWYLSRSPEGAIGETFGNLATWSEQMLGTSIPGVKRALATFSAPDDLNIYDFDNPKNLSELNLRPSEVTIRNKSFTQEIAADLFHIKTPEGESKWDALSWWSYHYPGWSNLMVWVPNEPRSSKRIPLTLKEVETLSANHIAVVEAAETLRRRII